MVKDFLFSYLESYVLISSFLKRNSSIEFFYLTWKKKNWIMQHLVSKQKTFQYLILDIGSNDVSFAGLCYIKTKQNLKKANQSYAFHQNFKR